MLGMFWSTVRSYEQELCLNIIEFSISYKKYKSLKWQQIQPTVKEGKTR